ncbi:MAG TPA: tetratricopeptide repeat protein, partial [Ktedonobacteraceae bacterium]|nr:tetratricopeptide repeat protein [Ktedonobacteraceae bacterium]
QPDKARLTASTDIASPATPEPLYDPIIPLPSSTQLIGRYDEMTEVKQRLFAGSSVALTALNGLPGVGKTALAIALVHDEEVRKHFRDGILWAGLGPDPNIDRRLIRWGTLLGLSTNEMGNLKDHEAWALALRSAIGLRHMLLVIDDAWNVDAALIFKVGGPNCAHLVTTRYPTIATHVAGDGATRLKELSEDSSMELLRLLAPQVISKEERKALDLVHAVGGLPLALTLMGNYLRLQAYSGQARRIQTALQRLSAVEGRLQITEPRGPVERHPSMPYETTLSLQSIIAVTDQQLSADARKALYALAVLPSKPDNFSEEAAVAIADCSLDAIDELIDAGLLESSSEGRYALHQTIADYARLHLQGTEPHERLIQYAHDFVQEHRTDYELLDLESGTIIAALEVAYGLGKKEELVRNVCDFIPYLLVRGNYSLAERHIQRAHEAAVTQKDDRNIVTTLLYRGQVAQKRGNYTQAETDFQEGLILARQSKDPERISAVLRDLGWVTWKQGNYAQAEEYLQEGLTLARQIRHHERISTILNVLGSVAARQGNYKQSETSLKEGLTLARQVGDREQICILLMNLGATVGEQGNHTQAESYFQEGLVLARQIGHREWTVALLSNLGEAAGERGNYAQAEAYLQEGLALVRQMRNREWTSALLNNLGVMTRRQGNYNQAEIYFQECLTLARQTGRPQITANALYEYGSLYLDQKQIDAAEVTFHEMLKSIPEGGPDLIALAQYGLARVAANKGNIGDAQRLGYASVTALEKIGHHNAQEVRSWLNSIKD